MAGSVHESKSKQALHLAEQLPASGPVSAALSQFGSGTSAANGLARMQANPALAVERGDFRSHMANTLGARNDLEAVNAWLLRYGEKVHTQRSYRKEVERFLIWCAQELKKPLSSVNAPTCQAYREFLRAVPAAWIASDSWPRTDPRWRAFRSQPGFTTLLAQEIGQSQ